MSINSIRRSVIVTVAVLSLVVSANLGVAQAHVLKEDNGISAVLHIPPDDNPKANEPTQLYLAFGDASNKFSLQNCDCQVIVKNNGQTVQTEVPQPALAGASLNSKVTITFPSVGVYDVVANGKAKDASFHAFQMNYLVRVATTATSVDNTSHKAASASSVLLISGGSLAVLGLFAYNSIKHGGRYAAKSTSKQVTSKSKSNKKIVTVPKK